MASTSTMAFTGIFGNYQDLGLQVTVTVMHDQFRVAVMVVFVVNPGHDPRIFSLRREARCRLALLCVLTSSPRS